MPGFPATDGWLIYKSRDITISSMVATPLRSDCRDQQPLEINRPGASSSGPFFFEIVPKVGAKAMNTIQQLSVERRMKLMPCTVRPSDSVAHARALLEERQISLLPVVSKERLVGIVSSRDLRSTRHAAMHRAIAKALEMRPDCVNVRSVRTTHVHTAKPSDDLAYAAR
jgi:hypothetical protein